MPRNATVEDEIRGRLERDLRVASRNADGVRYVDDQQ